MEDDLELPLYIIKQRRMCCRMGHSHV